MWAQRLETGEMIDHRAVAKRIEQLKPGCAIQISRGILKGIPHAQLKGPFGPTWSPVDRIMENIVGSSYEILTTTDPITQNVMFYRLENPLKDDRLAYVSPDRREHYRKHGLFWVPV